MKRCLIITGGKLDLSFAGSFLGQETFDKIIAVDADWSRESPGTGTGYDSG